MRGDSTRVNQVYGGYRALACLGSGGAADVYKAVHEETGELVALKCLRSCHGANQYIKEHMIAEGTLLSGLRHANVVRVLDLGIDQGVLWMAMELLSGTTLRARMKAVGALPFATALYYARELADGVAAAHEMRVIHRDLKPENVMITDQDEVKVLDMGAAKFTDLDMRKTQTGAMYGTPLYMSPEHIKGEPLDARSDVYSVGVILYEMIAGYHPIYGKKRASLGQYEVFHKQLNVMPPPLASILEDCPHYLSDLVQRIIAKDRNMRPSSMSELAQLVRRALEETNRRAKKLPSKAEITPEPPRTAESGPAIDAAPGEPAIGSSDMNSMSELESIECDDDDEEDDGDAETQMMMRELPSMESEAEPRGVGAPSARSPAAEPDCPSVTDHGTEIIWTNRVPAAPTSEQYGSAGGAPPSAASHNWSALQPSTPAFHYSRLIERSLQVVLGSLITAITLLLLQGRVLAPPPIAAPSAQQWAGAEPIEPGIQPVVEPDAPATAPPIAPPIAPLSEKPPSDKPKPRERPPSDKPKSTPPKADKDCISGLWCPPKAASAAVTPPTPKNGPVAPKGASAAAAGGKTFSPRGI